MPEEGRQSDSAEGRHRADTGSVPVQAAKRLRRPWKWFVGGFVGALTTILLASLTSLPGQLLDVPRWKDRIRPGEDLVVTAAAGGEGSGNLVIVSRAPVEVRIDPQTKWLAEPGLGEQIRRAGGADVGLTRIHVVLEGRSAQGIRITDIRPINIKRTAALAATLLKVDAQGGGEQAELMSFDLGNPAPIARRPKSLADLKNAPPFFEATTIPLADRSQASLTLHLVLRNGGAATFDLQFDYLVGGEQQTKVVDNEGLHFSVTDYNCVGRGVARYGSVYEMVAGTTQPYVMRRHPTPQHYTVPYDCPSR